MKEPTWLLKHKKFVYSQKGEDGIIEKILEILPRKSKWCVEFGAYDGVHFSNTRNLIENHSYSAVLIEPDKNKFRSLVDNYHGRENVLLINDLVGLSKTNNLDAILMRTKIPVTFDFLSIDIDGNDYYVWEQVKKYEPKIVCIEFNPTIPPNIEFVQKMDSKARQGSSILSLTNLAKKKGYELIAATRLNAFFVKKKYFRLFEISDNSPESLWVDRLVTYMFSGMDGRIILYGSKRLPWHNITLNENSLQYLPGIIRKFPLDYNYIEKFIYVIFLFLRDRTSLFKILKEKYSGRT